MFVAPAFHFDRRTPFPCTLTSERSSSAGRGKQPAHTLVIVAKRTRERPSPMVSNAVATIEANSFVCSKELKININRYLASTSKPPTGNTRNQAVDAAAQPGRDMVAGFRLH
jgi:hypothetical protein